MKDRKLRPNQIESLTALRRVLTDVVRPEVKEAYALAQIDHALIALNDLIARTPTLFPWLIESVDILRSLLGDVRSAIATRPADEPIRAVLSEIDSALETADEPAPPYPVLDDLERRVTALRLALTAVVPALGRHGAGVPGVEELQARIRTYLRQNSARS